MWNIIGRKNIFLTISGVLMAVSIAAIGIFGLREGIDFQGGALWRVQFGGQRPATEALYAEIGKLLPDADAHITYDSSNGSFLFRLPNIEPEKRGALLSNFRSAYPALTELSFQSIGPSVGAELRKKSKIAIGIALVAISLFIAFAFRKVYRPVSSWRYGWITLVTLLHDVLLPAGLLAIMGYASNIEIDGNFIVALLVVAGFSVHDTIVVFDRIRENLFLDRGKTPFAALVNQSVNQTIARSINTSLTLLLVLVALLSFGPINLRYFVLTLIVGVSTGIYSSIFVASPLLVALQGSSGKRR